MILCENCYLKYDRTKPRFKYILVYPGRHECDKCKRELNYDIAYYLDDTLIKWRRHIIKK